MEDYLYCELGFWDAEGEFLPDATAALPDDITDTRWKALLSRFAKETGYTWYKSLPEGTELDFRSCGGSYPELYDPDRYREILGQIFHEIDECLALFGELGLTKESGPAGNRKDKETWKSKT